MADRPTDFDVAYEKLLALADRHSEQTPRHEQERTVLLSGDCRLIVDAVERLRSELTAERKAWGDIQAAVGLGYPATVLTSHDHSLDNAAETPDAVKRLRDERAGEAGRAGGRAAT